VDAQCLNSFISHDPWVLILRCGPCPWFFFLPLEGRGMVAQKGEKSMTIKTPATFMVHGVPPGIFGETYVIISTWKEGAIWKAEYNILMKLPQDQLASRVIDFNIENYPTELEPIDGDYMEGEALRQAEIDLILALEQRAIADGRPELAYMPITLKRTAYTPVTLWVRDVFPQKFFDMAKTTQSPELKNYLTMVMSLRKLRAA
jgi:hypothetical protein